MRKWMRERLQRRKKKTAEPANQPASPPPPLQPAYFDENQAPHEVESSGRNQEAPAARETAFETQPDEVQPEETQPEAEETAAESAAAPSTAAGALRGRGRRRRGGRGRGGRGREQAPAAKGAISSAEAEEPAGGEAESSPVAEAAKAPIVPATAARPPKGIVVLAIGLPGSGKSSWFKRHNVVPLSSDMLRAVLFDDVREQRFQDLVFSNLRSMLKARLIAKRPMNYVDATNLTPQERQHWIKLAKDYNYEVHAVFFDVPLEVCIDRHQRRDRVVPEDIMRRMAAKLKPPAFDEGFAKITVVRVKKKDA
jgi:predicted kinase